MLSKNGSKIILSLVFLCLFSLTLFAGKIHIDKDFSNKNQLKNLYEIKLDGQSRIYLDLAGADIYFDDDLESIYISDELEFDKRGGRLNIFYPKKSFFDWFKKGHKIVIGTKNTYDLIDIDAGGINLTGNLKTDELKINSGGLDMSGDFICQEIRINGAGIDINGFIESKFVKLNGAGMDINIDVIGLEELIINGAGIDTKLMYVDSWVGNRFISINGAGGELEVMVPVSSGKEEDGHLDIDKSGFIDVDVDYY